MSKTITTKEMTFMEAMEIMEQRGKCPYCKQVNKTGRWVRTSFIAPGLCVDSAPKCENCPGRPPSKRNRP